MRGKREPESPLWPPLCQLPGSQPARSPLADSQASLPATLCTGPDGRSGRCYVCAVQQFSRDAAAPVDELAQGGCRNTRALNLALEGDSGVGPEDAGK